jgi:integrase
MTISKKAPRIAEGVDPAALPDRRRGKALLDAVGKQGKSGPRLVAYFACTYYAAMRPAEVSALHLADFIPPTKPGGWGEFRLRRSAPAVAAAWTDSRNGRRENRQLKHRAKKDFRVVPCQPVLAAILAKHIEDFGVAPGGSLFRGARGGPLSDSVTGRAWQQARADALSKEDFDAGVALRPYDLRHACVTGWLNAGVDPAQVAEWAGHSVAVLLRVYVRCIVGRDEIARKRIEAAFTEEEDVAKESQDPEQGDAQEDDEE